MPQKQVELYRGGEYFVSDGERRVHAELINISACGTRFEMREVDTGRRFVVRNPMRFLSHVRDTVEPFVEPLPRTVEGRWGASKRAAKRQIDDDWDN